MMKTKEIKDKKKEAPAGFTIDPALNNKYDNDPFFKEKAERAEEFIKKAGVPKF